MRIFVYLCFFVISFTNCGESNSTEECSVGEPVPVFSDKYDQILKQEFSKNGNNSVETVEFENGIKLELAQNGCESLTQEFRFFIPAFEETGDDKVWLDFAIQLFNYMGGVDISFADFSFWSQAIEQIRGELNVGTPFELAPNRWLKIDKIKSSDHAILIVTLSQQES